MEQGEHWAAVWNLEHAFQLEADSAIGGVGNRQLGEGLRLLRMGFANASIERMRRASDKLEKDAQCRALLILAKAQRLSCLYSEAESTLNHIEDKSNLSAAFLNELQWEQGCASMTAKHGCNEPISKVMVGNTHYEADYYTEAMLWVYAFGDEIWLKRLPTIAYQLAKTDLDFSRLSEVIDDLKLLHECYSGTGSMRKKIDMVGERIDSRSKILEIDREQLFLLGCARWLSRVSANRLAAVVLAQYRERSRQMTEGKSMDHLGVADDLMKKTWFKDF
jgi:hypothetical protein